MRDAGLPAGVVNILTMGHGEAQALCTHPRVAMITLTGGVAAGRRVLDYSRVNIAKSSLELGGKTPAIVAADADLEQAANDTVRSKTTNCGQLCTAVERVCVQRAVQAGTRLECAGVLPPGTGYFYPPTLLTAVAQGDEIVQEKVFGPVLCVLPCDAFDDALAMASDHQLGLAPVLYTENYRQVMQAGNEIEAGELYINRTPADPYQGYHAGSKRSGLGGDDGKHGMLEFTQTRLVVMPY